LNLAIVSGRAVPAKPSDSSSRKACKMASSENEKIERNCFTMKNVMSRIRPAGTSGWVTWIAYSSILVMAMYAPKALRPATEQTPNQLRMAPIDASHPNLCTFFRIRANAFQAALQKKVLLRAT